MSTPIDVAVIGGGVAGCSAAIRLAESGAQVALFEAKTYPHHKVCGEFLSPECADFLDQLGVMPALRRLNPPAIQTVHLTAPDSTTWEAQLPGAALGLSRYALDDLLAGRAIAAGVDLHPNHTVTDVHGSLDDGFWLTVRSGAGQRQVRARVVIAAHGKRGSLDRALNRPFLRQPQPFIALKAHFHGPPLPGRIELHAFPGGYCGLSEIEDGRANLCLLARQAVFQAAGSLPAFIDWMTAQNPRLGAWLSSATPLFDRWLSISQVPFTHKRAVENDLFMTGDAAGLIAPLAGDGIGMALQSGALAAQHTAAFLAGGPSPATFRQAYARDWNACFRGRLRLARLLQAFMLRPGWLAPGLRLLNRLPALGQVFIHQTRSVRPSQIQESM